MAGRPRKYPIDSLGVGESIRLDWRVDANGERHTMNQKAIHDAIRQEERRFGKKFKWRGSPAGLHVTRIR